ncbi:hypothetical protein HDU81_007124 [Chytriomyces hyalinus]|nr:hypothetical protein HDU81_007124 [Chytriomyces hyalinus]
MTTTTTTTTTTTLAPYFYSWGSGNASTYKLTSLCQPQLTLELKATTMAFAISDRGSGLWGSLAECIPDMAQFVANGGYLIISCGRASGPFLEDTMSTDQQFLVLSNLLKQTGCHALDFDVEGSALAKGASLNQRNEVISWLQAAFPGLYVSFTLPAEQPQYGGALSSDGVALLQSAKQAGITVSCVNLMTMDVYASSLIDMVDSAKTQLGQTFTGQSDSELYAMLGAMPMIRVNDDKSIFSLEDATMLGAYLAKKGVRLMSFWAQQRDQNCSGGLDVSTQVSQSDFEYYSTCKAAIEKLAHVPTPLKPTPNPTPPIPVQPQLQLQHQYQPQFQFLRRSPVHRLSQLKLGQMENNARSEIL